ncbi:cupin-like domain-containing protein [Marinobacter sp. M216]|uniref:Cupin-like domain-containing protein n=1 Tax=Marinobacter albus TaxID=3030833 RepID=A0ABT7HCF4_9GAMM|nr:MULTISPECIES: cupin-like domain-containing protein [unclassified Marinobacter]MBW7470047.1 cupin-like domain-containing protein [Marinobacter sp. F4218]MDK9557689.1 cupin-like domain-containing protein [Marinobacter sp. M216]
MMNLFDLSAPEAIETIPFPSDQEGLTRFIQKRQPVLLDGIREALPFTRNWDYEFFRNSLKSIRIQRKSEDGIYHYLGFERIPMPDFDQVMETTQNGYALEPLRGQGVSGDLPQEIDVSLPPFVPESRFRVSNLYIGPGQNKSLLHYDETHSLLMMLEGRKRFILFSPDQSDCMYPYSPFSLKALLENRVVDSKIDCQNPDFSRFPKLSQAKGLSGWLEEGQALFIPAGTWHFIEAEGRNVSVNYFWLQNSLKDWLNQPLLDFWIKRRAIDVLDQLRKVKHRLSAA